MHLCLKEESTVCTNRNLRTRSCQRSRGWLSGCAYSQATPHSHFLKLLLRGRWYLQKKKKKPSRKNHHELAMLWCFKLWPGVDFILPVGPHRENNTGSQLWARWSLACRQPKCSSCHSLPGGVRPGWLPLCGLNGFSLEKAEWATYVNRSHSVCALSGFRPCPVVRNALFIIIGATCFLLFAALPVPIRHGLVQKTPKHMLSKLMN